MIRICSYCTRPMGEKEPLDDKRISHGICEKCDDDLVASVLSRRKTLFVDRTKGEHNGMFHTRRAN